MLFDEDPLDRACRQIVETLTRFACLLELMLNYVLWRIWSRSKLFLAGSRSQLGIAGLRLRMVFSHLYWKYIHPSLVEFGLKQEPTWAEIEEHRLRAIARTGVDIPRPPALEAGLQQELGLDA